MCSHEDRAPLRQGPFSLVSAGAHFLKRVHNDRARKTIRIERHPGLHHYSFFGQNRTVKSVRGDTNLAVFGFNNARILRPRSLRTHCTWLIDWLITNVYLEKRCCIQRTWKFFIWWMWCSCVSLTFIRYGRRFIKDTRLYLYFVESLFFYSGS